MSKKTFLMIRSLYLLGDGAAAAGEGDGGTGTEGATGVPAGVPGQQKGNKNPLANVKYGVQQQEATPNVPEQKKEATKDRTAEFENLIKGEYKDLYDARVQDTIQKRLKASQETVDKYNALTPTLEMLAKRYGVDPSDEKGLIKAIYEDDSYYENEAMEKGVSVDQLKAMRKMERENAELKRKMQEAQVKENAERIMADWMRQAEGLKSIYPGFDLDAELRNPKFIDLLKSHIDVRTAFEVIHKDDIIGGAMKYAVTETEKKITNKIRSGYRPTENGVHGQAAPIVKSSVSQLSKDDRREIARRVANGEHITFSE